MRLFYCLALFACVTQPTNGPAISRDTTTQINSDPRYAHDSSGQVILGPSDIAQRVYGQADAAGNVHVVTDHWFIAQAHQLSCAQLSLAGQMGGASPEVRQLANRLASQNQRLNQRLRDFAAQRRVTLEACRQPPSLSGERDYLTEALSLDRQQLSLWDDVLRNSPDRQLAQFASDTLPELRSTHQQAVATSTRM